MPEGNLYRPPGGADLSFRTWEVKSGGIQVQGQLELYGEIHLRTEQNKNKNKKERIEMKVSGNTEELASDLGAPDFCWFLLPHLAPFMVHTAAFHQDWTQP